MKKQDQPSQPIENRYEFMLIFDCENGNPNGDPEAENLPRTDAVSGFGLVSDVAIKRHLRNYVALRGQKIFVEHHSNLNQAIFEAREATGTLKMESTQSVTRAATKVMCERFFDVRTFGAVMTTGANAGQATGPVQITMARSMDPVRVFDWAITRMAIAKDVKGAKSVEDFQMWHEQQNIGDLQTIGRKSLIPYGLYVAKGFISAYQAANTGFSEADLEMLLEGLMNMFEHSRSASRGMMSTRRLIVFRHLGNADNLAQRVEQAKLGRAPTQYLLDLGRVVSITKTCGDRPPMSIADYAISVDAQNLPKHIEMLDLEYWDQNTLQRKWIQKREPTVPMQNPSGSWARKKRV